MTESYHSKFLDDPEFQSLLVACFESLQRGDVIDVQALERDFPQYATAINQFLDNRQLLEQLAIQFEDVDPSKVAISAYEKTLGSNETDDFSAANRIRYIGEYEILDEVARGGMGIVFKAKQQSLNRIVALKMILSGRLADDGDVERFRREAKAAGRLKHSNIVPVHEIGEFEGRHYFTMDFVDGSSLADIVRDESLESHKAAELVRSISAAVHYAHQRDVVHRDLKPANILIDRHGVPQITDFGLAKILESVDDESKVELTASGQILGTPSYMSPEQAAGKQSLVGSASDIYSLGTILYFCLTGRAPFVANSPVDTLLQVINKEPVSPRELNPLVPQDLETICLKCLSKEPHRRYESAQDLADDLNRFFKGRPVLARPVGAFSRTIRWCRRNPMVASLLALVALLMVTGTAVSTYFAIAEHDQRLAADDARGEAERERDLAEEARRQTDAAFAAAEAARQRTSAALRLARDRERETREQLYVAHMNQAMSAWENDNIPRVRQLLAAHIPAQDEPDNRGFEWSYLDRLVNSHVLEIPFEQKRYLSLDCSPDGRLVAVRGPEWLEVFAADTGESVAVLDVQIGREGSVVFSPDGTLLVTGGYDHLLQAWDTESWEKRHSTHVVLGPRQICFHPDCRSVVYRAFDTKTKIASIRRLDVLDVLDGRELLNVEIPVLVRDITLHPSGREVAVSTNDNVVQFYDTSTGQFLRSWKCPHLTNELVYSPDGGRIAIAANQRIVQYRNAVNGKVLHEWETPGIVYHLAAHPDGVHLLAGGTATTLHLFNVRTGEHIRDFRGHGSFIVGLAFRPGTQQIVSVDREGSVKFWDRLRESKTIVPLEADTAPDSEFDPTGRWLAVAQGVPWDRDKPGFVELFDAKTGARQARLDGHEAGVFGLAFDIDGARLASADADGRIVIWDVKTHEPLRTIESGRALIDIAFWPDGTKIIAGGDEGLTVWDTATGEKLRNLPVPGGKVQGITVSPNGPAFAASSRSEFVLWNADGNELANGDFGGGNLTDALAFSPDGRSFVCGSGRDIVHYDARTGKKQFTIPAHSERITGLKFLPNGRRFVSKTHLGEVKVWDLTTRQSLLTVPTIERGGWNEERLAVDPAGERIVIGSLPSQLVMVDIRPTVRDSDADPEFWVGLARQQAKLRQWKLARENFDRALELHATPRIYIDAAATALLADDVARFSELVQKAIEIATNDPEAWTPNECGQLAQLVLTLPSVVDDLGRVEGLVERNQSGGSPGSCSIYLHWRKDDPAAALETAEAMFRSKNRASNFLADAFMFRTWALARLGRNHEAAATLPAAATYVERALTQQKVPLHDRASIKAVHGELDRVALEALNQAIEENDEDPTLFVTRGNLHRRWRRWEAASNDFRQACDLRPRDMDNLKAAVVLAALAGQVDERHASDCQVMSDMSNEARHITNFWSIGRHIALAPRPLDNERMLGIMLAHAETKKDDWWKQIGAVSVLHRMGRNDQAAAILSEANAGNDWRTHALTLLWRSLIEEAKGNGDKARKALADADRVVEDNVPEPGITTSADEVLLLQREAHGRLDRAENNQSGVDQQKSKIDAQLPGEWQIEQMQRAGKSRESGPDPSDTVTFQGSNVTIPGFAPGTFEYRTEKANSASEPARIDHTARVHNTSQEFKGLYEIKEDTLTLVINEIPGGSRPTQLTPVEEEHPDAPIANRLYVVLRRLLESRLGEYTESTDAKNDEHHTAKRS